MFPIDIKLIVLNPVDKSVIGKGVVEVSSCHLQKGEAKEINKSESSFISCEIIGRMWLEHFFKCPYGGQDRLRLCGPLSCEFLAIPSAAAARILLNVYKRPSSLESFMAGRVVIPLEWYHLTEAAAQRVTMRCRLSWLTNIWAQMRGGGEVGSCVVSANELSCTHGAQINFGDLTLY